MKLTPPDPEVEEEKRLKKIPPYWFAYTTMAKERWYGREVLEVVSTEFRDRSMEYYVRCRGTRSSPAWSR